MASVDIFRDKPSGGTRKKTEEFLRFIYVRTYPFSGSIVDEYEIKLNAWSERSKTTLWIWNNSRSVFRFGDCFGNRLDSLTVSCRRLTKQKHHSRTNPPKQQMFVKNEGRCLKLGCWKQPSGIFSGGVSIYIVVVDIDVCSDFRSLIFAVSYTRCEQKPLRDDDDNKRWMEEIVERIKHTKEQMKNFLPRTFLGPLESDNILMQAKVFARSMENFSQAFFHVSSEIWHFTAWTHIRIRSFKTRTIKQVSSLWCLSTRLFCLVSLLTSLTTP